MDRDQTTCTLVALPTKNALFWGIEEKILENLCTLTTQSTLTTHSLNMHAIKM